MKQMILSHMPNNVISIHFSDWLQMDLTVSHSKFQLKKYIECELKVCYS